ncbi:glutamine amidotransferase-related protein [Aliagarivorans marinus]|uniref:glutamine amidotransferase-related protein n=1 Tax=Aliagarivorans marinus TaxID=561965 RepID=UPI000406581D|nr:hypothetical protein [Aliagarivorans marinus]
MRTLAILNCDYVDPALAAEYGEYYEMFIEHLRAQNSTLTFEVFQAIDGQLPPLTGYAGYLITGSRHNAHDDEPWIVELVAWCQQAYQQGQKLAGICFGHQLLARALGGVTANSDKGWGLGCATTELIQAPSWASKAESTRPFHLLVSHQDQVQQLPNEATLLARSEFCPLFMYQVGEQVFCVQGHPEFAKGYAKALIDKREDILSATHFQQAQHSLALELDDALVFRWILELFVLAENH